MSIGYFYNRERIENFVNVAITLTGLEVQISLWAV